MNKKILLAALSWKFFFFAATATLGQALTPTPTPGACVPSLVALPTPSDGLGFPDEVALDPTRQYLYVAEPVNSRVSVYTYSQSNLPVYVTHFATGDPIHMMTDIVTDAAGNLYVADYNGWVNKFSFNGSTASLAVSISGGMGNPRGLWVDPTGTTLYIVSQQGIIYRRDWNGSTYAPTASFGNSLNVPTGIVKIGNILYVTDSTNNRVVYFTETPGNPPTYTGPVAVNLNLGAIPLNNPFYLKVDGAGHIIVPSNNTNTLLVFNVLSAGNFSLANAISFPSQVHGFAVDAWNNYYVTQALANQVVELGCLGSVTLSPTATPTFQNTPTQTLSVSMTSTPTLTGSSTRTPTWTPTFAIDPTPVLDPTPVPTSGCVSYSDDFSGATLGNYDYFMNSSQAVTTAAGAGFQIQGGVLETAPPSNTNNGGMAVVRDPLFSHALSDYTVEGDFEMDSLASGMGVFGLAFRTGTNGSFYCFQWNGNPLNASGSGADWEIEKNTGGPSVGFSYPAGGKNSPAYSYGTWVHMKVVCLGNHFLCYLNFNDGVGDRLIFNLTDNSAYANGGVGVRTYGIFNPNVVRIDNFQVNTCPSGTPIPTGSPASTLSFTPTLTGSSTRTPTPTLTMFNTWTSTWTATNTPTRTPTTSPVFTFQLTPTWTPTPVIDPTPAGTVGTCDLGSWHLNGSATIVGNQVDLTTNSSQAGSAWAPTMLDLTQDFNLDFTVYLGSGNVSDGIAFLLQTQGTNALGGVGGGLGYGDLNGFPPLNHAAAIHPSVAVEIDTFNNIEFPDPVYDHVEVVENGVQESPASGIVPAMPGNADITDGQEHDFNITWSAANKAMTVYLDGRSILNYSKDMVASLFGGNNLVYWGLTGGTGGPVNTQYFKLKGGCAGAPVSPVPTFTWTPTFTSSWTPTNTPTRTATNSPTPTGGTATTVWTSTWTPTPFFTAPITVTSTWTPTDTPTRTATSSPTPTGGTAVPWTYTYTPSPVSTVPITLTPVIDPTPVFDPTPAATTPMTVTGYGCFAQSGDGGDLLTSGVVAPIVPTGAIPWNAPAPCGLQWISDNPNGYTPATSPSTILFNRAFVLPASFLSNGQFTLSFKADDAVEFYLNGQSVAVASCVPPPGNDGECQGYCHVFTIPASAFTGGINTLQVKLINLFSVQVGNNTGWTSLSYSLCVSPVSSTGSPTPGVDPTPVGDPTPAGTASWTPTRTPTASATSTNTPTYTRTWTPTWTPTPIFTVPSTFTPTPTHTPLTHVTVTPTRDKDRDHEGEGYPNPCSGDHIRFFYGFGPYQKIHLKIYSLGFRLVCHREHVCSGQTYEEVEWDLRDNSGMRVGNGIYYVQSECLVDNHVYRCLKKVLILR